MSHFITLVFLTTLVLYVSSDQILPTTFKMFFPGVGMDKVKMLTTNVNNQTTIAKAKTVVKNWMTSNWKASTKKSDDVKLAKIAYAEKKVLGFIDHRFSIKKYINSMASQAVNTKFLTKQEADTMKSVFWAADLDANNLYQDTNRKFMVQISKSIPKTPSVAEKLQVWNIKFAEKNPQDLKNMNWQL